MNTALKLDGFYKRVDKGKYQEFLTIFYELSVKLSSSGGDNVMQLNDLSRRAGSPPDN